MPALRDRVAENQAFAWNPWAPGVKVEDTVVLDGAGGVEVLSADPAWPRIDVRGVARPATLEVG